MKVGLCLKLIVGKDLDARTLIRKPLPPAPAHRTILAAPRLECIHGHPSAPSTKCLDHRRRPPLPGSRSSRRHPWKSRRGRRGTPARRAPTLAELHEQDVRGASCRWLARLALRRCRRGHRRMDPCLADSLESIIVIMFLDP